MEIKKRNQMSLLNKCTTYFVDCKINFILLFHLCVTFIIYNILQIIVGSIVQVLLCIGSSYFLWQFHRDLRKFQLMLCSAAFGFNGLLFTIDAIIMFQQIIFSRPIHA